MLPMRVRVKNTTKSLRTARTDLAGEITLVLSRVKNNPESLKILLRLAYGELHGMAVRELRTERAGHSVQPTALVNQVCLRFLEENSVFKNRRHFFGAVTKAMRRFLVDSSRRRRTGKRGGGWRRVDFQEAERIGFEQPTELLDFDDALTRLASVHPLLSEAAELRVFGGLTAVELGSVLGIGESTARRRWAMARQWLRGALANYARALNDEQ